jgi:hypothetical protein
MTFAMSALTRMLPRSNFSCRRGREVQAIELTKLFGGEQ